MNSPEPPTEPEPIALTALVPHGDVVFAARTIDLPAVIVYSNADVCGQALVTSTTMRGPYAARRAEMTPVMIHRLPEDAAVLGNNSFLVRARAGGRLVAEQMSPLTADLPGLLVAIGLHAARVEQVQAPCVLVARYGEATWGHWLAEILPAAVVAEHAFPGRFLFAVPDYTTHPGPERDFATAVVESLAAYGIGDDRLLRMRDDRNYQFAALHMVSGLWSSAVLNPDVLRLMREAIVLPVPEPGEGAARISLLRPDGENRALFNNADITARLSDQGFTTVNPAKLSFLEQVSAFRHADEICGILGSGLTGLIYARDGVRVLSIAPADWFDFYFYMLLQQRQGFYVDFRGPVLWNGRGLPRDAPIVVDPAGLQTALEVLRDAARRPVPAMRVVCGIEMPTAWEPGFFAINFGAAGNAGGYLEGGWSLQEGSTVWSVGPQSLLRIPLRDLPDVAPPWLLELDVASFAVPPCLVARLLHVTVGDQPVGSFLIGNPVTICCRIPPECISGRDDLVFVFSHPICPPATVLGVGVDTRELGIAFVSLRLRALETAAADIDA